jgi:hypothetical protein
MYQTLAENADTSFLSNKVTDKIATNYYIYMIQ